MRRNLADDWAALRGRRFDLVFAALVLQHIETAALESYVADMARMAPLTYVLTRGDSDFGGSVLAAVGRLELFTPVGPCVEVEHDERTHQLRAIRELTFADVCRSGGASHYEVLLRSRDEVRG